MIVQLLWSFVVVLFSAFVGLYLYMTRNFDHWKKKGVAELKPVPFFGNFYSCVRLKKTAGQFLEELYNNFGDQMYVGFHIFDKPCIMVRDPEAATKILVTDFNIFANKFAASDDHDTLGSASLLLIKAHHWKPLRSKLSPVFAAPKLKKMFQLIVQVGEDLDRHLEAHGLEGDGRVIELKETCIRFSIDLIGTSAYGLQVNCLNNPDAEFRECGRKIFDFTYKRALEFGAFFFAPGIVKPLGLMFFEKKAGDFLRKVFWETLIARMETGIRRNDLIDALIDLKKNQTQADIDNPDTFKFDGDNLTAQAAFYFIAGFETTSGTLAFTLYELALNQEIQSRLRREVNTALRKNDGKIAYDWVMELPYLDMVISESLRKYPPIGYQERISAVDYELPKSDIVIAKGTPVWVSISGFHHDPNYFPDPDKFDPERFSSENKQTLSSHVYMPFGKGPRNCIGFRFAQLSLKLGIIKMIANYRYTPCKETIIPLRMSTKSTVLTTMDHGLFLNVQKVTPETD